jgi:hypothetical protein
MIPWLGRTRGARVEEVLSKGGIELLDDIAAGT